MPDRPSPQPPFSTPEIYSLLGVGLTGAGDAVSRAWQIGFGYLSRAADMMALGALEPWSLEDQFRLCIAGYGQFLRELAWVPGLAWDAAVQALANPTQVRLSEFRDIDHLVSGQPDRRRQSRTVQGKPLLLPARVADASQGWGLYEVAAADAQRVLAERLQRDGGAGAPTPDFEVVMTRGGRTLLGIFGVEYRDTDLGQYNELGVVMFVRPRGDVAAPPGEYFLELAVNQRFTLDAAREIWHFNKSLIPALTVIHQPGRASFLASCAPGSNRPHERTLAVTFPRVGAGRSTNLPFFSYSVGPGATAGRRQLQSLFVRSGQHEAVQVGGKVALQLGHKDSSACLCSTPDVACICDTLRGLGLTDDSQVAVSSWTGQMSGELHAPRVCG